MFGSWFEKGNCIAMLELSVAVIIGFSLGYGLREWISHQRRQALHHHGFC